MKRPDIDTDPHSPQALRGGTNPGLGLTASRGDEREAQELRDVPVEIRMPPFRREDTTQSAPPMDPNNSIDELLEGISRQPRTVPPGDVTSKPLVLANRVSESSRPPPPPSFASNSRRRIDTTTVPSARAQKASMVRGTWLTLVVVLAILGAAILWRRHASSADDAVGEPPAAAATSAATAAGPTPMVAHVDLAPSGALAPAAVEAPAIAEPPSTLGAPPARREVVWHSSALRPAPHPADLAARSGASPPPAATEGTAATDAPPPAAASAPPMPPARDLELLGGTH